jgi:hypothetical protein
VILLIVATSIYFNPGRESQIRSEAIVFAKDYSQLDIRLNFEMNLVWDKFVNVSRFNSTAISYSLHPLPASIVITLPLEKYFSYLGWKDTTFSIPLGDTPMGEKFIPWFPLFNPFAGFFSVGINVNASVRIDDIASIDDEGNLSIEHSDLIWNDYGEKSISYELNNHSWVAENIQFLYELKIGIAFQVLQGIVGTYQLLPNLLSMSIDSNVVGYSQIRSFDSLPSQNYCAIISVVSGVSLAYIFINLYLRSRDSN